jgi:hypothetical protein
MGKVTKVIMDGFGRTIFSMGKVWVRLNLVNYFSAAAGA